MPMHGRVEGPAQHRDALERIVGSTAAKNRSLSLRAAAPRAGRARAALCYRGRTRLAVGRARRTVDASRAAILSDLARRQVALQADRARRAVGGASALANDGGFHG